METDKDHIIEVLAESGYKPFWEDGVAICKLSNAKEGKRLEKLIKKMNYKGSWGYRIGLDGGENFDEKEHEEKGNSYGQSLQQQEKQETGV